MNVAVDDCRFCSPLLLRYFAVYVLNQAEQDCIRDLRSYVPAVRSYERHITAQWLRSEMEAFNVYGVAFWIGTSFGIDGTVHRLGLAFNKTLRPAYRYICKTLIAHGIGRER
jgi:hypothetical protein